jgi:hypothetical protein
VEAKDVTAVRDEREKALWERLRLLEAEYEEKKQRLYKEAAPIFAKTKLEKTTFPIKEAIISWKQRAGLISFEEAREENRRALNKPFDLEREIGHEILLKCRDEHKAYMEALSEWGRCRREKEGLAQNGHDLAQIGYNPPC